MQSLIIMHTLTEPMFLYAQFRFWLGFVEQKTSKQFSNDRRNGGYCDWYTYKNLRLLKLRRRVQCVACDQLNALQLLRFPAIVAFKAILLLYAIVQASWYCSLALLTACSCRRDGRKWVSLINIIEMHSNGPSLFVLLGGYRHKKYTFYCLSLKFITFPCSGYYCKLPKPM